MQFLPTQIITTKSVPFINQKVTISPLAPGNISPTQIFRQSPQMSALTLNSAHKQAQPHLSEQRSPVVAEMNGKYVRAFIFPGQSADQTTNATSTRQKVMSTPSRNENLSPVLSHVTGAQDSQHKRLEFSSQTPLLHGQQIQPKLRPTTPISQSISTKAFTAKTIQLDDLQSSQRVKTEGVEVVKSPSESEIKSKMFTLINENEKLINFNDQIMKHNHELMEQVSMLENRLKEMSQSNILNECSSKEPKPSEIAKSFSVNQIQLNVEQLIEENENLVTMIKEQQSKDRDSQAAITQLQQKNAFQEETIHQLNQKIDFLSQNLTDLSAEKNKLAQDNSQLRTEYSRIEAASQQLQSQILTLESQLIQNKKDFDSNAAVFCSASPSARPRAQPGCSPATLAACDSASFSRFRGVGMCGHAGSGIYVLYEWHLCVAHAVFMCGACGMRVCVVRALSG